MAHSRGRCLLRPLLKRQNWTQAELARRAGYSPRMISHFVNNEKKMSPEAMYSISMALNCKMEELYEWVETGAAE